MELNGNEVVLDGEPAMTFDEYQDLSLEFAMYDEEYSVLYPVLGLVGEAGEVAEKLKKRLRDFGGDIEDPVWKEEVKKELGDILWYLSAVSDDLGFSLAEVADSNITKLTSRALRGTLHGSGDNR